MSPPAPHRPQTTNTLLIVFAIVTPIVMCMGVPMLIVVCLAAIQILGQNANSAFGTVAASIGATVGPAQLPTPPLALARPPAPAAVPGAGNLRNLDIRELLRGARQAVAAADFQRAAAYQYWAVQKTDRHQYDLACYCSRSGDVEAGFYWLQQAGVKEGVDAAWAGEDEDLEPLRRDRRWPQVRQFLHDCERYWARSDIQHTVFILPEKYRKPAPLTLVMWLHGLGSRPDDFVDDDLQELANELNIGFVGVSGTQPRGPNKFVWSEEPEQDAARLHQALVEARGKVVLGPVILMGFSQGAQMALEVAVREPENYAGAIVMSPGLRSAAKLQQVRPSPLLARRGFVLVVGAKEHPGNVALTASDARWLERTAKAQVQHKPYPNMAEHAFPADFADRFPEWVRFIEQTAKK